MSIWDWIDEQIVKILAEGKSAEYPDISDRRVVRLGGKGAAAAFPATQELLRCCAFFGPEPIPRDVFRRGTPRRRILGSPTSCRIPSCSPRAIRELGRFALVSIGRRSISVHRLVQALLRGELDAEEQTLYRHDVHKILAAAAPPTPADDRQWPRYRELLPHVTSQATTEFPHLHRQAGPGLRAWT